MSNTSPIKMKSNLIFAAIDPYVESVMVSPKEKVMLTQDRVEWGTRNAYPEYLLDLYNNVPTLHSIIDGNIDYITGDDIVIEKLSDHLVQNTMNYRGDTINEQVRDLAKDYEIYGGFALQIIRNLEGKVSEVYYLDMRYLRCNKECDVFYYSEEWLKSNRKVLTYPKFMPDLEWATMDDNARAKHSTSILFVKRVHTQVYPAPLYAASVKACEIERLIDDYHINSINNQFASSAIINLNRGIPTDEVKKEIERNINEKFSGAANAGRIMVSFNPDKDSATDITEFKVEDFGEKYKALSQHSRQQIFTAFRANPNLFGIPTESNGFANEQYAESFKLYNRTQIQPVQRLIADTYDKIYGRPKVMSIKPFSLGGETENNVN